ncbi:hypothetical protein BX666DRAFT_1982816 [Dichotomocladium elegans]|nr:hypothetical protein BX666DRAFT_1982816 [Dichotomocladium elegans]
MCMCVSLFLLSTLAMEKCVGFIPLRIGTLLIDLWFFLIYLADVVTGLLGSNAVMVYSSQGNRAWYIVGYLLSVSVSVVGLSRLLFGSYRSLARVFGILLWGCCVLSFTKYMVSLVLMWVHRTGLVHSCRRSGLVGLGNTHVPLAQAVLSDTGFYSPVARYPGTLTEKAMPAAECASAITAFLVTFAVLGLLVQCLQVHFAMVGMSYAHVLSERHARHHRLRDEQIKDFEESRYRMVASSSTTY